MIRTIGDPSGARLTIFIESTPTRPAEWLAKCIDSCTDPDFLLVISTDSATIDDMISRRWKYSDMAQTPYWCFVDDDDWINAAVYHDMIAAIVKADVGGAYCGEQIIREGEIVATRLPMLPIYDSNVHWRRGHKEIHRVVYHTERSRIALNECITDDDKSNLSPEYAMPAFVGIKFGLVPIQAVGYFWRHHLTNISACLPERVRKTYLNSKRWHGHAINELKKQH